MSSQEFTYWIAYHQLEGPTWQERLQRIEALISLHGLRLSQVWGSKGIKFEDFLLPKSEKKTSTETVKRQPWKQIKAGLIAALTAAAPKKKKKGRKLNDH